MVTTNKKRKCNKKGTNKVPVDISVHLKYLYQDKGIKGAELLKKYPQFSKATIYRHAKAPIGQTKPKLNQQRRRGRPAKLSGREKRMIIRQIPKLRQTVGSFTTKRLREAALVKSDMCDETVRRFLHSAGYHYYHSRKKGLLTKKDLKKRVAFARKIKRMVPNSKELWEKEISFYIDAAGFQHKYNPFDEAKSSKTMAWRRRDEGLENNCTAKGSHVGSGGKVLHFMVAISYTKGVILCESYEGRINGEMFGNFIRQHFPLTFEKSVNPTLKQFLQDGDPSQNSKKAKLAMDSVGATIFSIPPRSPDINPIENVFNYVKQTLHKQALEQKITFEDVDQYRQRVKQTLQNTAVSYIDKTIETMDKRMLQIIKAGGKRIKY